MERFKKVFYKVFLITIMVLILTALSLSVSATDAASNDDLSCRMYGAISDNFPNGLIEKNLVNDQYSLRNMARLDSGDETNYNINGWGIASYANYDQAALLQRGAIRAYNDPSYNTTISQLNSSEPKILIAHIRHCTSGCCLPLETVANPHPFTRTINGKTWTFEHNGGVTKTTMISLINAANSTYLAANAPFGSGVPACITNDSSATIVVDSELYFLYVLEMIQNNNWNVVNGITAAIKNMNAAGTAGGSINFIMSDGENVYGFKKSNELFYKYDAVSGYSAVASAVPNSSETGWTTLNDWQLIILKRNQAPTIINDVRTYVPQAPPTISNPNPANGAINVSQNPALQATINDSNNDAVNWNVQLLNGSTWTTIGSGTAANGNARISVSPTTITSFNTLYSWKVTATDPAGSNQIIEAVYTFTTKQPAVGIGISNPVPQNGQFNVQLNTNLSAYVEDRSGYTMNITFSIYNGTAWKIIKSYTNSATGAYTASGAGYITKNYTNYQWRVNAVDTAAQTAEANYNFTTAGQITLKWTATIPHDDYSQILPVMGDIDNDGNREIVVSSGSKIIAINGKTGQIKWQVNGSAGSAAELVDLDGDGTPEILFGMTNPDRVRALNGNGSIRWTSPILKGDALAQFPLVAADIDGSGHPRIYFATEDTYPTMFTGNLSDYNGALSMLDYQGNLLGDTWLYHPCWGGLSIADPNYDGHFIVYVSDRRGPYNNVPAKGLQAYDAKTLQLVWNRADIMHSSAMAVLADVTNDGNLDVVAEKIVGGGVGVLNATTGQTLPGFNYFSLKLPTHGTGTVYDIDGDGHLEDILSMDAAVNVDTNTTLSPET